MAESNILFYLIFLIVNTGILILVNIEFFRISILLKYDTYSSIWTILFHNFLYGILFLIIPLYIHKFINTPFKLLHKAAFGLFFVNPSAGLSAVFLYRAYAGNCYYIKLQGRLLDEFPHLPLYIYTVIEPAQQNRNKREKDNHQIFVTIQPHI